MTTQRTPLPFLELYDESKHGTGQNGGLVATGQEATPERLGGDIFWGGYDDSMPSPEEISEVARRCNAHDALVVACAEAARRFAPRMDHDSQYVLMMLNDALLLAREGVSDAP